MYEFDEALYSTHSVIRSDCKIECKMLGFYLIIYLIHL